MGISGGNNRIWVKLLAHTERSQSDGTAIFRSRRESTACSVAEAAEAAEDPVVGATYRIIDISYLERTGTPNPFVAVRNRKPANAARSFRL